MSAPKSLTFNTFLMSDLEILNEYKKLLAFPNQSHPSIQEQIEHAEILLDSREVAY